MHQVQVVIGLGDRLFTRCAILVFEGAEAGFDPVGRGNRRRSGRRGLDSSAKGQDGRNHDGSQKCALIH